MPPSSFHAPAPSGLPTKTDTETALVPISSRVAELLKPTRTLTRYSDFGYEGETELWEPRAVTAADIPELRQQLTRIEAALTPADPGALLSRVHVLLSHYRNAEIPAQVEAAIAADWLDDLGEFPIAVIVEACRRWRRHPIKYRFKPLPGDIRGLCLEISGRLPVIRERLRTLLAAVTAVAPVSAAARAADVRSRVIALAQAKRMPELSCPPLSGRYHPV